MCIPERVKINPISLTLKILADQYRFAFKEKNFELKGKKKILIICHFPCAKFKHATGHRERNISWLEGQERGNDNGIAPWQILQLQNLQLVPHGLGYYLQISIVTYLQKSLFKISNPVFFQAHATQLVRCGPLTASNYLGKMSRPSTFLPSLTSVSSGSPLSSLRMWFGRFCFGLFFLYSGPVCYILPVIKKTKPQNKTNKQKFKKQLNSFFVLLHHRLQECKYRNSKYFCRQCLLLQNKKVFIELRQCYMLFSFRTLFFSQVFFKFRLL